MLVFILQSENFPPIEENSSIHECNHGSMLAEVNFQNSNYISYLDSRKSCVQHWKTVWKQNSHNQFHKHQEQITTRKTQQSSKTTSTNDHQANILKRKNSLLRRWRASRAFKYFCSAVTDSNASLSSAILTLIGSKCSATNHYVKIKIKCDKKIFTYISLKHYFWRTGIKKLKFH